MQTAKLSTAMVKPVAPSADFPLYAHGSGQWAKKINGRTYYFGSWNDPDAALASYVAKKDELYTGKKPASDYSGITVCVLVNKYLDYKHEAKQVGKIQPESFAAISTACSLLLAGIGRHRLVNDLGADDFTKLDLWLRKSYRKVTVKNHISRIRSVFLWGHEILRGINKPTFGTVFKTPTRKELRKEKRESPKKLFSQDELAVILTETDQPMKAMAFLGINCAYGNTDCGELTFADLDLDAGWVKQVRAKTEVERRSKLWPETIAALRDYLAERPEPADPAHKDKVFIMKSGKLWCPDMNTDHISKDAPHGKKRDPISERFGRFLRSHGIKRMNVSFYALRHTFQTIADDLGDPVAVKYAMGHADDDISDNYREGIFDPRLERIANHVRKWAFTKIPTPEEERNPDILTFAAG